MESEDVKSVIPLPDELLTETISRFIPFSQWSRSLEYVSRQFQRCILIAYGRIKSTKCIKLSSLKCNRFTHCHEEKTANSIQCNSILEKLLTICPNLADIDSAHFQTPRIMHRFSACWDLLAQFDRLQSISLWYIEKLEFRPFAYFVANSKSLKFLNATFCEFDSAGILDVGSLSVITFRYNRKEFSQFNICLENLSEKLTALTVNSLERVFKADPDAMKHCSNLERFSVSLFTLNDYEIFSRNLPSLCKLTRFQIYSFFNLISSRFNEKFCSHFDFLKNQLRCIEFNGINVGEEVQHFLLTKCTQLQSLILSEYSALSDSVIKNLRHFPANLKMLTFPDRSAETLTISLPNLVKLMNLTDLKITDNSCTDWKKWENICCLVNLHNLHLYSPRSVNDALLQAWDKKNPEMFEKLVTFEIRHCFEISDIGGILLASKAQNLKHLDFCGSRISEKTILVLANFAKNLVEADFGQGGPLLFDENAVISLICKATRLKKVIVNPQLVEKVMKNEKFLPLAEYVEIDCH